MVCYLFLPLSPKYFFKWNALLFSELKVKFNSSLSTVFGQNYVIFPAAAPEFSVHLPSALVSQWATGHWNGGHCVKLLDMVTGDGTMNSPSIL